MILRLEHIGIAVKSLEDSNAHFEKLLGIAPYKEEEVVSEHVRTSFLQTGEAKIELLEATHPDSAIAKYLEKKPEGLHHIAFEVDDIYAEMERLRKEGFQLLNAEPKRGADNKLVCFVHPRSANGVLLELCQTIVWTLLGTVHYSLSVWLWAYLYLQLYGNWRCRLLGNPIFGCN